MDICLKELCNAIKSNAYDKGLLIIFSNHVVEQSMILLTTQLLTNAVTDNEENQDELFDEEGFFDEVILKMLQIKDRSLTTVLAALVYACVKSNRKIR